MKSAYSISFLSLILSLSALASSPNWPQFRGPDASGVSDQAAPTTWDLETGKNIRWQKSIPGLGHACPIIWQDRVYIATAVKPGGKSDLKVGIYGDGASYQEKEPHQWRLLCFDKRNGKVLWDKLGYEAVPRVERHTKASHCNSTPATDGKRIVAIFGSEGLFCFDMYGNLQWHKDLGKMDAGPYNDNTLQWGFASSPILHNGKVVVQCDVLSEKYLAVFDAEKGTQLWRVPRKEAGGTWCTPAISVSERGTQIVCNGWKDIGGYDFERGRQLWHLEGGGDIPVPTPVVAHDLAFLTSAHGNYRPLRAVRLDSKGDITPPSVETPNKSVIWCLPKLGSYMQTPLLFGSMLFSCDWYGVLSCVEAGTGQVYYSERLGPGGEAFTASPVAAGQNLYFTSEPGNVYVVSANTRFTLLSTNSLGDLCLSTPAVSEGTLFFRTRDKLIAVGRK
jgi:outer membrane protein assembly factor BamB